MPDPGAVDLLRHKSTAAARTLQVLDHPDVACPCVADHNPEPLELHRHHIWPLGWGGPDDPANVAVVCPNAHATIHVGLRHIRANGGTLPWAVGRHMSPWARGMVYEGYRLWRRAQEGDDERR